MPCCANVRSTVKTQAERVLNLIFGIKEGTSRLDRWISSIEENPGLLKSKKALAHDTFLYLNIVEYTEIWT